MTTSLPHRLHCRGQSLVEFALVVGILIFVTLAGIDVLQYQVVDYTVQHAVVETANAAALYGGNDNGQDQAGSVERTARLILDSGALTRASEATRIAISCAGACRRYDAITVAIEYRTPYWVPIGPFTTIAIRRSASRASEQDRVLP